MVNVGNNGEIPDSFLWDHAREPAVRNFLIAFFFYIDGVLTIIVTAGTVATETFGFTPNDTLILFLVVQISALVGAFALAKPTDTYGPKKILNGVLVLWIVATVSAFFIQSPTLFWGMAVNSPNVMATPLSSSAFCTVS